jgi:uncharacterized protein involved in exopolysaccharide biosynthesis
MLDVLAQVRRARGWMFAGVILGAALALFFLMSVTPLYKAQMIVGPASPISTDQAASAAGVRLAPNSNANDLNFTRFENTLAGPSVAGALLKDERIFGGIIEDHPLGFLPAQKNWSPQKLAEYMRRSVRIDPIGDTKLRRLSYYHADPEFAAYFLARAQEVTDELIRRRVKADAGARIEYLQKASSALVNPEHRRALTDLLMEQERVLMLASVDQPYAAAVIEPALSSYKPKWPSRTLALLSFIMAGALAGFVVHGLRSA